MHACNNKYNSTVFDKPMMFVNIYLSRESEGHGEESVSTNPSSIERSSTGWVKTGTTQGFTNQVKQENKGEDNKSSNDQRSPDKGLKTKGSNYQVCEQTKHGRHKHPHES